MTSSQNLSSIEPWLYLTPPNFADTWLSETQTFTLALQQSLSSDHSPVPATVALSDSASPPPEVAPPPRRGTIPATGKATKRRSRASKRATTTFITADPANFREMVQQVTGVRFSGGGFPTGAVAKPEPMRAATGRMMGCLPTLDTSAFLLDQNCTLSQQNCTLSQQTFTPSCTVAAPAVGGGGGGGGFDFESFCNFPTLESWN